MNRCKSIGAILLAVLAAAVLAGCNQAAPKEEQDPRLLNFPGLQWGMTPDEVRDALSLEVDQEQEDSLETGDLYAFAGSMEFFGAEGAYVIFRFWDCNGDGTFSLSDVAAWLPASTDMDALRDAMVEYYGTPAKDYPSQTTWESELLRQDIMSEEDLAYVKTQNDYFQEILTKPVTTIVRSTTAYHPYTFPDGTASENSVGFDGSYAYYTYEGGLASWREAAGS